MAETPLPPAARADDDPFLREVDEEYRRDVFRKFLRDWGRWLLLAVGVGLVALAGVLFWREQTARSREAVTEKLVSAFRAIEAGNSAAADAPLAEVRAAGSPGQRALAAVAEAGLAALRSEPEKAIGLLQAVAADASVAQPLRDLATVKALRLQADSLPPEDILARARPWLEGDSPWFPAVAEIAAAAHLRGGREAEAAALFLRLARTAEAPETQRARAEQMAAMLGEDTSALADDLAPAARADARQGSPASAEKAGE